MKEQEIKTKAEFHKAVQKAFRLARAHEELSRAEFGETIGVSGKYIDHIESGRRNAGAWLVYQCQKRNPWAFP